MPNDRTLYEITTWDMDRQAFTPQDGVPPGPHSIHDLRRAMRLMREHGYECHYQSATCDNDSFVLIERIN